MLKKMLIPLVVLSLSGVSAGSYEMEAKPSKVFIGVQAGKAWVQGAHNSNLNHKTGGLSYGLRLGAQNSEWRTMLTFDRFKNDEASYERGEVHANYLLGAIHGLESVGITPFIGINVGYANYEANGTIKGEDGIPKGINESGLTYGGEAGVIVDVTENIDVDIMYQYTIGHAKAFDHVGNLKVGINYKY